MKYSSHTVNVVEATINQSNEDIVSQVAARNPNIVGISTYIWNAGKLPELLKLLRQKLPETIFVLGGPEATHNAEYWLEHGADYVAKGEVKEFFNPCSDEYFASLENRIAYIETSRGCPFRCAFCLSAGTDVQFLLLDQAFAQIDRLCKTRVRTIKFVDRTFNCNPARAYEIFGYIINLDTEICFHFEVGADLFDKRMLALLSTAPRGRIQFEAGLQSFFPPALKASSRKMNLESAEENIRAILEGGNIHIHVDLIAGLPYETLADFSESFNRAYKIGAHHLQLGFLKLLHGSSLREQYKDIILHTEEPPYEITSSPWLSAEDLTIIKHTENALQRTYNKGRFLSALEYALNISNLQPFEFYRSLGEAVPNHGMPLNQYAERIYKHFTGLDGVNPGKLRDCMIIDWLGMVKGENIPNFLKTEYDPQARKTAENTLGRKIGRYEFAVLSSGKCIFVDSKTRDPVTELYRVFVSSSCDDE